MFQLIDGLTQPFDGFFHEEPKPCVLRSIEAGAHGLLFCFINAWAELFTFGAVIDDIDCFVPPIGGSDVIRQRLGNGDETASTGLAIEGAFDWRDEMCEYPGPNPTRVVFGQTDTIADVAGDDVGGPTCKALSMDEVGTDATDGALRGRDEREDSGQCVWAERWDANPVHSRVSRSVVCVGDDGEMNIRVKVPNKF